MILVLDSGALSALVGQRARLAELRRRGHWPPQVPSVVLTESLTGDARRDAATNQLVGLCQIRPVTEHVAREGARLRTRTGRAGEISAVDAVIAAFGAEQAGLGLVLTADVQDLRDLCQHSRTPVAVHRI